MSFATATFLWFTFAWDPLFHPYRLSVWICPYIWSGSLKDSIHKVLMILSIQPVWMEHLVGAFNPFMFKVIIDKHVLNTIFGNCFGFISVGLFSSFPLLSSCDLMAKFSVVSEFLFLYLCMYLLYWVCQSVHLRLSEDLNVLFGQPNRFLVSGYHEVLIE